MSFEDILDFVRAHRLAVVATVSEDGSPEAALMGIAMTTDNRIVFDTVKGSRKYSNLRKERRVAIVVGWENESLHSWRALPMSRPVPILTSVRTLIS